MVKGELTATTRSSMSNSRICAVTEPSSGAGSDPSGREYFLDRVELEK